jgi:peptide/nickel transport system permease protein
MSSASASAAQEQPQLGAVSRSGRWLGHRLRQFVGERSLMLATGAFGLVIVVALYGLLVWPHDPLAVNIGESLQSPSWAHPMGTDELGRDIYARWSVGAKISVSVGLIVLVVGGVLGTTVGLIAGTSRSGIDNVLMRVMDAILAFPPLLLAMAVTLGLGAGLKAAVIGIVIPTIPWYARLVRSDVLRLRSMPFVEATVALGARRSRTLVYHVFPHTLPTLAIQAGAVFSYAILSLAALGFVGLGVQIPTPEWGTMITEGLGSALTGQWWVTFFPGMGLLITATAANLLADWARDVFDPKARSAGR